MKTIRKLIYAEVLTAITLVTLGFLSLFLFFDLVDELQGVGRGIGQNIYQLKHALLYVTLLVPSRLYELLPISVPIGTIFVMARFAQSSEYTILRTSGLWRALRLLLSLGAFFVVFSFLVGDYLAPAADRASQLLKAKYQGRITVGQTGAWLKEKQNNSNYVVNVKALSSTSEMQGIRIYEFNGKGAVLSTTEAAKGEFAADGAWELTSVSRADFLVKPTNAAGTPETASVTRTQLPTMRWPTSISTEMVSVALLKPERMATLDLFNYVRHLEENGQTAQRYEIEFWKKVFYPLSCLVMVILALPFAYLHFRSGGIASYVFAGVMIGISFFLMNNVFGYIGNLQNWQPWLAAAAPGMFYMAISLGAFGWLVIRR